MLISKPLSKKYLPGWFFCYWFGLAILIGFSSHVQATLCHKDLAYSPNVFGLMFSTCGCVDNSGTLLSDAIFFKISGTSSPYSLFVDVDSQICDNSFNCRNFISQEDKLEPNRTYLFKNMTEDNDHYSCETDANGKFTDKFVSGIKNPSDEKIQEVIEKIKNSDVFANLNVALPIPLFNLYLEQSEGGHVYDQRGWLNCGAGNEKCKEKIDYELLVELYARALPGYQFDRWTGDCEGTEKKIKFKIDGSKTCSAEFSKVPEKNSLTTFIATTKVGAYSLGLLNTPNYQTIVSITNLTNNSLVAFAKLYKTTGQALNNMDAALILQPQQTVSYTLEELQKLLQVSPWTTNVWLELRAEPESLRVMHLLNNPDGTLTNLSLARQNEFYNVPSKSNAYGDELFLQFINVGTQTLTNVTGTLYNLKGEVVGNAQTLLFPQLAPKAMQPLTAKMLEERLGSAWLGRGWLKLVPSQPDLQLLGIIMTETGTWHNISPAVSNNRLYNLASTTSRDHAYVRMINTTEQAVQVRGTLFNTSGQVLGQAETVLVESLPAHAIQGFNMEKLEKLLEIVPWSGKAQLVISEPATGIVLTNTLRSASRNITSASATEEHGLYYLPSRINPDQNTAFMRIANTSDQVQQVVATLWDKDGIALGIENTVLIDALAPDQLVGFTMEKLEERFGIVPWDVHARLEITSPQTGIKVMAMNRSANGVITNLSGSMGN